MDSLYYDQLGSSEPMEVLSGLVGVSSDIKDAQITPNYANTIYHRIIPLLNHNHYKIRTIAFSLAETIFVNNIGDLSDISLSIPILIFSLASVNKVIVKSSDVCLRVVFETFDASVWWQLVEENILHSKSYTIRKHLLSLLINLPDMIPLDPIVVLLDDPKKDIRDLAEKILLSADENRVISSLRASKVSFDVYQKIYKTFLCQSKTKETKTEIITISEAPGHNKKSNRKPLCPTQKAQLSEIEDDILNSETNSFVRMNSHANSSSDQQKKILKKLTRVEDKSQQTIDSENEDKNQTNALPQTKRRRVSYQKDTADRTIKDNYDGLNAKSRRYSEMDSPKKGGHQIKSDVNDIITHRKTTNRSSSVRTNNEKIDSDTGSFKPILGRKNTNCSASGKMSSVSDKDEIETIQKQDKTVGQLVEKPKINLPFALRDMSQMSWLEKSTFLEHFRQSLDSNYQFSTPASEIARCLLTSAFPLHHKVSPILAKVLTKLSYQNPEVLRMYLMDVLRFLLHAIRHPATLTNQNGADELLDAILVESSQDELIEAILAVKKENQRPLLIEEVVLSIYKKKPDTILSQITIRDLLCYMLHSNVKSDAKENLLYLICQKETDEVIKFYNIQSREVRKQLIHYIPKEAIEKYKTKKIKNTDVSMKDQSQMSLSIIIQQEMKKGSKGNFKRLALALQRFRFDNADMFDELFLAFLKYLARIPDSMIKMNSSTLSDVCNASFNTVQVFNILSPPFVRPQVIKGFCIYVWHCPMTLLNSASAYYERLYDIFKEADGDERRQIVGISIAIEKVTKVSILSIEGILKQHKTLIENLIDQYDVFET